MSEKKKGFTAPILHISPEKFAEMIAKGEAKVIQKESELVKKEKEAWEAFLGKKLDKPIPEPPQELFKVMEKAKQIGWTQVEAHYLPGIAFSEHITIPGWTKRPEKWYWEKLKEMQIEQSAPSLTGSWICIDTIQKPNYNGGKQMYSDDPFEDILMTLRLEKKLLYKHIGQLESRFEISFDQLDTYVLPEIAQTLDIPKSFVRIPRAIEFNILGNLFHSEWGNTDTSEWFWDRFTNRSHLIGGDLDLGGLRNVRLRFSDVMLNAIGFRPMIVFPNVV